MNNCHFVYFAPIFVRGQNDSKGAVGYVDATSVQNIALFTLVH